ncbi:MAG: hypothetical protein ACFFD8_00975 [Candidatus Thorarchaeota archaeon]
MTDHLNTLIIDIGSGYIKYGTPNQAVPLVMPAALKKTSSTKSTSIFHKFDPGRRAWVFPFEDGLLPKDMNLVSQLCNLVIEQFPNLNQNRENLELMLLVFPQLQLVQINNLCHKLQEVLSCLRVDAAIQQVLSWGYWGKKTGLIVDVGYTVTFIAPIYRGFLLDEQIVHLVTGSFFVSAELRKLLLHQATIVSENNVEMYSQIANNAKAISAIKQSLCKIYPKEIEGSPQETVIFPFRDTQLPLGAIPWQAPEVLFQPTLLGVGDKGLTDAIIEVLHRVDTSVRAELASNIVLTGGGSMIPGLKTRLEHDLKTHVPHLTIKVNDLAHPIYSSWLGAVKT